MIRRRQSRLVRHAEPGCSRLQERDLWLLDALAKMRFLTTSQIARLAFDGSRWAANKRSRKLLDAGLVRVWVRDLARDNVYALDRRGASLLVKSDAGDGPRPTAPRGLDRNLDHLVAINDVRLGIALANARGGGEIAWWRSDWELRGSFRERLVPDALFAVRWNSAEERIFALEVDNESRSWRGFLGKLLGYAALQGRGRGLYGVADFPVLVVCRDPRWLERYRDAAVHSRLGCRVWFTTLDAVRDGGSDAAIWRAGQAEESSIRTLAGLPYGKEALGEKSYDSAPGYRGGSIADIPLGHTSTVLGT